MRNVEKLFSRVLGLDGIHPQTSRVQNDTFQTDSALDKVSNLLSKDPRMTRRTFLILTGLGSALAISAACLPKEERDESQPTKEIAFKDKVLSFSWEDAEDREKLEDFVESLADSYLQLTQTPRITKEDLVGQGKTTFHQGREEFLNAIRKVEPDFEPTQNQWGYTHYETKRIFIDIGSLHRQSLSQTEIAGLALLDALWHEWGHLDVIPKFSGELIDNSQAYFYSPNSKKNEPFKKYRGGAVYTDTYYGFIRFNEVWNETIIVRRMIEQVGLEQIISARDYYENGIDFFPKFTLAVGIPLETMYQMHAASDFEGFAKFVGLNLPGNESALEKGIRLFAGIHRSDANLIRQTGVFEHIPK